MFAERLRRETHFRAIGILQKLIQLIEILRHADSTWREGRSDVGFIENSYAPYLLETALQVFL